MTDAPDYDAIEARADAATEGPWHSSKGGGSMGRHYIGNITSDTTGQIAFTQTGNAANSQFIAHARTDVPALIARCRDLEAKVAAIRGQAEMPLLTYDHSVLDTARKVGWDQKGAAILRILDSKDPT